MTLSTNWQMLGQAYVGKSGGSLYARIYARYSEQDIANNRTYVYYQARSYYENGSYIQDQQGTLAVSGDGANYNSTACTYVTSGESVSVTTEGWVYHNNEGRAGVTGNASLNFPNWGWLGNASGYADLPTIPRASGIACSSPSIGDTATITIDKKAPNFTNTVTYQIGNITGTIAEKTSSTVLLLVTSTIEDQIYALIPNSREIQGTVYCTTYNGGIQIGNTQSSTFNLYAKESVCRPNVRGVVTDTNPDTISITGDNKKFIKYASKPKVSITATANKSSEIISYLINLNDGQTSNLNEYTFDSIGSDSVTIQATDSRGYTTTSTIDLSKSMTDYIKLHIDSIDLYRPEGTSNEVLLNCNGVWFNDKLSQSLKNIEVGDNLNGKILKFNYDHLVLSSTLNIDEEYSIIECSDTKNKIYIKKYDEMDRTYYGIFVKDGVNETQVLYARKSLMGISIFTKLEELILSDNFGTVSFIDTQQSGYNCIKTSDSTKLINNTLTAKYQYRVSGNKDWTDGGQITATVEKNTFKFNELSLGNIYDYQEEYQFKVIINDLLMTVGNLDTDVITVSRGQEVVAIGENGGWLYGDWFLNDKEIPFFTEEEEWEE